MHTNQIQTLLAVHSDYYVKDSTSARNATSKNFHQLDLSLGHCMDSVTSRQRKKQTTFTLTAECTIRSLLNISLHRALFNYVDLLGRRICLHIVSRQEDCVLRGSYLKYARVNVYTLYTVCSQLHKRLAIGALDILHHCGYNQGSGDSFYRNFYLETN